MNAHPLTAVVADDEQPARDELCYLLDQIEGVEVVAQAANGLEAVETIVKLDPDLAFLDIQMPGLTGLEVVRRLQGTRDNGVGRLRDSLRSQGGRGF